MSWESENAIATSARRTQIELEMSALPERIAVCHEAVAELEKRLQTVLADRDVPVDPRPDAPRELLVPFAEALHVQNEELMRLHRRLVVILDTLEL